MIIGGSVSEYPQAMKEADSTLSVSQVRRIFTEHYGHQAVTSLEHSGRMVIVPSANALPDEVKLQVGSDLGAVTAATTANCVYFIADRISASNAAGVFLHEVGEHAGLASMLGDDYGRLVRQFDRMLARGDSYAAQAAARVPTTTPSIHIPNERLAYLVEAVANDAVPATGGRLGHALGQDCLSRIRAWLFRTPICRWLDQAGALQGFTLTPTDIASLALAAVDFQVREESTALEKSVDSLADDLDHRALDSLFASTSAERRIALAGMDANQQLGYLYSLCMLGAPGIDECIDSFKPVLAEISAGQHSSHLRSLASGILDFSRRTDVRTQLNQQLDRTGFAMWEEQVVSGPGRLYFLTPSPKQPGQWQLNLYVDGQGAIDDTQHPTPVDALATVTPFSYPIADEIAETCLQHWANASPLGQPNSAGYKLDLGGNGSAMMGRAMRDVTRHGLAQAVEGEQALLALYQANPALAGHQNTYQGLVMSPAVVEMLIEDDRTPKALAVFLSGNRDALSMRDNVETLVAASIRSYREELDSAQVRLDEVTGGLAETSRAGVIGSVSQARSILGWLLNNEANFKSELIPAPSPAQFLDFDTPITLQDQHVRDCLGKTGIDGYFEVYSLREPEDCTSFVNMAEANDYLRQRSVRSTMVMRQSFPDTHPGIPDGAEIYTALVKILGSPGAVNAHLSALGIPGTLSHVSASGEKVYTVFVGANSQTLNNPADLSLEQRHGPSNFLMAEVPGVVIEEPDLVLAAQRLEAMAKALVVRAESAVTVLAGRLEWVSRMSERSPDLVQRTRCALADAVTRFDLLSSWVCPGDGNVMNWSGAISDEVARKIAGLHEVETQGLSGEQIFNLIEAHCGNPALAAQAFEAVGVIGAYSDGKLVLWDEASEQLSESLGKASDLTKFHIAYHGSPHEVDRFSTQRIGSGEGAASYGHGLYFAQRKTVAGFYQQTLTRSAYLYEDALYTSPEHLANSVAPAIAAQYPHLHGEVEGLNALDSAIRQLVHVSCNYPERVADRMLRFCPETQGVVKFVLGGIAKVGQSHRSDFFVMPPGGARTLNEMWAQGDTSMERGLMRIEAEVRRTATVSMSDDELVEAYAQCCAAATATEYHMQAIAELESNLAKHPGDRYLMSRLGDEKWELEEAKNASKYLLEYGAGKVCRPLGNGNVYMVDLCVQDSEYLRFDLPFKQQSKLVQQALLQMAECDSVDSGIRERLSAAISVNDIGEFLHGALAARSRSGFTQSSAQQLEQLASQLLLRHGVQGVKYPDGDARYAIGASPAFNYVIFDDSRIQVLGHTSEHIKSDSQRIPIYEWADIDLLDAVADQRATSQTMSLR